MIFVFIVVVKDGEQHHLVARHRKSFVKWRSKWSPMPLARLPTDRRSCRPT